MIFKSNKQTLMIDLLYVVKHSFLSLVGRGCRIHQRHPCNECLGYSTKQFDGEVSVMLAIWECGVPHYRPCSRVQFVSER